jgi:hypothetical protein
MKTVTHLIGDMRLKEVLIAVALGILIITAVTALAHADDRHDRGRPVAPADRGWHEHEGRAHHYWGHPEPGVIYAPPVVYAPPPPPEYESPGINLILPLHIR